MGNYPASLFHHFFPTVSEKDFVRLAVAAVLESLFEDFPEQTIAHFDQEMSQVTVKRIS